MDKDFKHQMTKPGETAMPQTSTPAENQNQQTSPSPPLSFIPVWGVLDMAAKGSGLKEEPEHRVSLAEASLMAAVARQSSQSPPTVCLSGFRTGHGAIVWLESATGARVLVFDPFAEQHQRGSNAFLQSLYKGKFIPLPGPPLRSLRELAASGLPVACDIVHLDIDRDGDVARGVELLTALRPIASGVQAVVLTGAATADNAKEAAAPELLWRAAQRGSLLREGNCQAFRGGGARALCAGGFARGPG